MTDIVTLPFKGGYVKVSKGCRIKVYRMTGGSVKGYLLDYNPNGLIVFVPDDYGEFMEGILPESLQGHKVTIPLSNLGGFDFYPEVTILEIKEDEE
ncbi:MAG: hypothetical protein QXV17_07185 [Candidatus Micrarchaeaceae archaeon]